MSNLKPQMLSWMVCDAVHVDPATGKYYLLGVFSQLHVRQFPAQHPRMVFFLSVAGVSAGKHKLSVSYGLPMEEQTKLFDREFEAQNPMQRISLISELQGLGFKKPGNYAISVDIDDENLLVTSLAVTGPGTNLN
jgi:hypothetical protein